jgi:hypothetical protein
MTSLAHIEDKDIIALLEAGDGDIDTVKDIFSRSKNALDEDLKNTSIPYRVMDKRTEFIKNAGEAISSNDTKTAVTSLFGFWTDGGTNVMRK